MMNRRRHVPPAIISLGLLILLSLVTASVAIAGCAPPPVTETDGSGTEATDTGTGTDTTGTGTDTGTGVTTNTGVTTYTVELSSNGSTGYSWAYTMDPAGIIEEVSQAYTPDDADTGANHPIKTGGGGTRSWVFKAIRPGTVRLQFEYKRSWETAPPARTATYTLSVDSALKVTLVAQS
jgi:inhibitor of cysteine peptidase